MGLGGLVVGEEEAVFFGAGGGGSHGVGFAGELVKLELWVEPEGQDCTVGYCRIGRETSQSSMDSLDYRGKFVFT